MIKIIGARNTGKTKLLLEAANKVQGKANAYGFYDVHIINYQDLIDGNYYFGEPFYIQKAELFLDALSKKYGLDLQGITFTED